MLVMAGLVAAMRGAAAQIFKKMLHRLSVEAGQGRP
jgi:hypothetical protein